MSFESYQASPAPATVDPQNSAPGAGFPMIAGRPYDPALAAQILALLDTPPVGTLSHLSPFDVAAAWARSGLRIFPCRERLETADEAATRVYYARVNRPDRPPPDAEAAPRKAKSPYGGRGHLDAKSGDVALGPWLAASPHPRALIGLSLAGSRALVLDFDRHDPATDGVRNGAAVLASWGIIPTAWVRTSSGGIHVLIAAPAGVDFGNRVPAAWAGLGIDVRGPQADGSGRGFVIAAGSRLADGRAWVANDPAAVLTGFATGAGLPEMPAGMAMLWRVEARDIAITRPTPAELSAAGFDDEGFALGPKGEEGRRALAFLARWMPPGVTGANDINAARAFRVGSLVRGLYVTEGTAADALVATSEQTDHDHAERTIRRQIEVGAEDAADWEPEQHNAPMSEIWGCEVRDPTPEEEAASVAAAARRAGSGLAPMSAPLDFSAVGRLPPVPLAAGYPSPVVQAEPVARSVAGVPASYGAIPDDVRAALADVEFGGSYRDLDIPPTDFAVGTIFPIGDVSILYGDGGTGKSWLALQLSLAIGDGAEWLGMATKPGRALFYSAEDVPDNLRRRFKNLIHGEGASDGAANNVGIMQKAGEESILCHVDPKTGQVLRTKAMEDLEKKLHVLRPRILFIDTLAITYGGNEIDRSQVQAFMSGLRRVALASGTAIVLLAHPSRSGMTSGDGASGSTQWSNSARCRMYLRKATDDEKKRYVALHSAPGTPGYEVIKAAAEDLRILEEMKNNEATRGAPISLMWKSGGYGFTRAVVSEDDAAAARVSGDRSTEVANLALSLIRKFTHENPRPIILDGGRNNAATLFAEEPAAKARAVGKDEFRDALQLLFSTGRIRNGQVVMGKATRQTIYDATHPPPNLVVDAAGAAGGPFGSAPPLDIINPQAPVVPFALPVTADPAPIGTRHQSSAPALAEQPFNPFASPADAGFTVPPRQPGPTFAEIAASFAPPPPPAGWNPFAPPAFNPFAGMATPTLH